MNYQFFSYSFYRQQIIVMLFYRWTALPLPIRLSNSRRENMPDIGEDSRTGRVQNKTILDKIPGPDTKTYSRRAVSCNVRTSVNLEMIKAYDLRGSGRLNPHRGIRDFEIGHSEEGEAFQSNYLFE